jgi:hypothetical protein
MWHHARRLEADGHALECLVARAGAALACPYSTAEEFEAAVIRARREAGIYGPKRYRRFAAGTVATALALLLGFWLI